MLGVRESLFVIIVTLAGVQLAMPTAHAQSKKNQNTNVAQAEKTSASSAKAAKQSAPVAPKVKFNFSHWERDPAFEHFRWW